MRRRQMINIGEIIMEEQHVYIVGSKGCGNYGGYETFLDKLTEYHQNNKKIKYHIAWKGTEDKEFEYNGAHSFQIKVPNIGSAQAIYYDVAALNYCLNHIKNNHVKHPIVYILACRIGPFAAYFQNKIHKLGGDVYVNPDGHEWMRAKWSVLVRKYWKISENMMVKHADLLVCDSNNIEKYIKTTYKKYNPKTTFIAYGADLTPSKLTDDDSKLMNWYVEKGIKKKDYYLVVGRFVPENSFEIMIREFMKSKSKHDFAIITTVDANFQAHLEKRLHYKEDKRIKFVGTVYDQEMLKKIRENAYAYFHGHTVGGTNPSLIEALGSTDLNLLVDVGFNQEVAEDSAWYWSKDSGDLANLINQADAMSQEEIKALGTKAKKRVAEEYTWEKICGMYEKLFLTCV
jgi:rhamnosyltransferase